mmetsp:Transcript_16046/g.51789  ORF Transcript_16046/g.51789 Transcript_16046/m.51789 type:complete len:221 (+) Transcript_16046:75-737(+)
MSEAERLSAVARGSCALAPASSSRASLTTSRSSSVSSARSSLGGVKPGRDRAWVLDDLMRAHWSKPPSYGTSSVALRALQALNDCCGPCEKRQAATYLPLGRWSLVAWQPRWLYSTPSGLAYCRAEQPERGRHLPFQNMESIRLDGTEIIVRCDTRDFHFQPLDTDTDDAASIALRWAQALEILRSAFGAHEGGGVPPCEGCNGSGPRDGVVEKPVSEPP